MTPGFSQFGFRTGAVPTPKHKIAAATPHFMTAVPPPQFGVVPKQLDAWGNRQYGDCVSAEEAFAKADWSVRCGLPELFIPVAEVIRFARAGGYLNGASLTDVMDSMARDGFHVNGQVYGDGPYRSVDYSNETVLQSALVEGPVKLGMASDSLPSGAGNEQGWYAVKTARSRNEDHCTGISAYGSADFLYGLLGVPKPSGVAFPAMCYLFFTWSTLGVVSHDWLMGTVGEAWVRTPTTPGQSPAPVPPPPPPVPPAPAVTLADAQAWVSAGFDGFARPLDPESAKAVACAALSARWPR